MRIYNQHYFILAQNLLNTRSQRFNYSWNTIKMKITRRQSKKTIHPLLKNTHVYSTFNPVYIKRNLSCAKKSIQLLEEVNHLHRYPEFIQPKIVMWVEEGSWRKNYFCMNWNERRRRGNKRSFRASTYSFYLVYDLCAGENFSSFMEAKCMPTTKLVF